MCTHMLQDFQKYAGTEHNSSDVFRYFLWPTANLTLLLFCVDCLCPRQYVWSKYETHKFVICYT